MKAHRIHTLYRARTMPLCAVASAIVLAGCSNTSNNKDWVSPIGHVETETVDSVPDLAVKLIEKAPQLGGGISARQLSNGAIIVADYGSAIVEITNNGNDVRQIARNGEGPGELSGSFYLETRGDSVFALGQPPASDGSVAIIPTNGEPPGRIWFRSKERRITAVGMGNNGFRVVEGFLGLALWSEPAIGSIIKNSHLVGTARVYSKDSTAFMWSEWQTLETNLVYSLPNSENSVLKFSLSSSDYMPRVLVVSAGDGLWRIDPNSRSIRRMDSAGNELSAWNMPLNRIALSKDAGKTLLESEMHKAVKAQDTARVNALFSASMLPDSVPFVSGVVAGAHGTPWLTLISSPTSAHNTFVLLDSTGIKRLVNVSKHIEVQQILDDAVLGVVHDADEEPSVVRYKIKRGAP